MYYIYSTLANDVKYTKYKEQLANQSGPAIVEHQVLINGKVGVANKHLVTPRGVVTSVSDSDYELLKEDYHFKEHIKEGYISVEKKQEEVEKIISKMNKRDKSAPIVPEDYQDAPKEAVVPREVRRKRG